MIILPAMTQLALAAVINPDGFGNVLVTTGDSGPHNIQTGFFPVAGAHEIRVDAGAVLNPAGGDVIEVQVFDASGATYTINNNGILTTVGGPGNHGIDTIDLAGATPSITVNNNGSITGFSAIRANDTLTLTNNGSLVGTGFSDGAVFAKNGGTITNNDGATILGNVHGIQSELVTGTLTIANDSSIVGTNFDGINSLGIVNLTNSYQQFLGGASTVSGNVNGVVGLGDGSSVTNYGNITGTTGNGAQVGANATIDNLTSFGFFGPVYGGQITGGVNGVVAGDGLTLTNNNLGLISGGTGDGINTGINALIVNNLGATISGDDDGIEAGVGADITNHGMISGDYGIYLPDGDGVILNTGTISGTSTAILISDGPGVTITNTGLITSPDTAIYGDSGDEILNFNLNSRIVGDVLGDGGLDTINFDGGLTSPFSLGNSVSGDVLEFTNINKTGSGTALIGLPGDPLYNVTSDNITISSGGLYINADISGHTVGQSTIIAGGSALGGTGLWEANILLNSGGISAGAIPINLDVNPLNSIGTLDISGDVTHAANTFIRYDVRPEAYSVNGVFGSGVTTGFDGLEINGGTTGDLITHSGGTYDLGINSVIRVSPTSYDSVISDGTYFVVDSDAFIPGDFPTMAVQFNSNVQDTGPFFGTEVFDTGVANTSAVLNLFMESDFLNGDTDLVFTVQHDYEGLGAALGGNEAALGAALDASVDSPNALIQDFIASLDFSDLATVQDTLQSLIPTDLLNQAAALISSNYRVHRLVQDHLAMARSSGAVIVETPATTDAKGGIIPAQTTTTGSGRGNVWGTFSYDWKDSGDTDFDGEDASFTAGVDYRIAPNFLLGILLDGSQGDYDYNGGSSDVDSLRIAVYGTYGESTGLYADFLVGYGDHDLDTDRDLGGILIGSGDSSTDASSIQAMLTVGYAMESGGIKHGPFAGFEYQNIDVDSYSQNSALPLSVDDFDVDSLRGLIGYRAQSSYGQFTPYASIAYAHEFEDGDIEGSAVLPGGASFRVRGGNIESAVLISLGTGYAFTPNLGLNVGYHGEISVGGDDGMDSHGGSIGLNYAF